MSLLDIGAIDKKDLSLQPFLRWPGGKRWLVEKHPELFPRNIKKYIEPFLGSGAVFFWLCPPESILSDSNKELIETYQIIKEDWESVYEKLYWHHLNHGKEYYYKVRSEIPLSGIDRAARFIYLIRTCWNGLYRVNTNGRFNVPIGTKKNVIIDTDNFCLIQKFLINSDLKICDFEDTIEKAQGGDFLFIDPPYITRHNNNGFVKYNENLFTWKDQVRLSNSVLKAAERGVIILLTNADHDSIKNLYINFINLFNARIHVLERSSILAAKSTQRGRVTELALTINYESSIE